MFAEKKRFCCIKANTGGAAGQMIRRGTKWDGESFTVEHFCA